LDSSSSRGISAGPITSASVSFGRPPPAAGSVPQRHGSISAFFRNGQTGQTLPVASFQSFPRPLFPSIQTLGPPLPLDESRILNTPQKREFFNQLVGQYRLSRVEVLAHLASMQFVDLTGVTTEDLRAAILAKRQVPG
jgi:hypothetical protein